MTFMLILIDVIMLQLTKSGKKIHHLLKKEWWTDETLNIPRDAECQKEVTLQLSAFYGSHRLTAEYDGASVWSKVIDLEPASSLVIYIEL